LKTIQNPTSSRYREKGSKFIGYLFPVSSTDNFENELQKIKSKYPDATHHCYGWRINPNNIEEFAQDDGEPSGTAGLPILNQLKSFEVINCGCIVVRYYGGTNLGKSGLIQAYGHTTKLCLEKASLVKLIPTQNFQIRYPYGQQSQIDQLKNQFNLKEINAEYLETITLDIACHAKQAEEFLAALERLQHHGIQIEEKGAGFVTLQ
jgi:uncharacterized YigZ family protein